MKQKQQDEWLLLAAIVSAMKGAERKCQHGREEMMQQTVKDQEGGPGRLRRVWCTTWVNRHALLDRYVSPPRCRCGSQLVRSVLCSGKRGSDTDAGLVINQWVMQMQFLTHELEFTGLNGGANSVVL